MAKLVVRTLADFIELFHRENSRFIIDEKQHYDSSSLTEALLAAILFYGDPDHTES